MWIRAIVPGNSHELTFNMNLILCDTESTYSSHRWKSDKKTRKNQHTMPLVRVTDLGWVAVVDESESKYYLFTSRTLLVPCRGMKSDCIAKVATCWRIANSQQ